MPPPNRPRKPQYKVVSNLTRKESFDEVKMAIAHNSCYDQWLAYHLAMLEGLKASTKYCDPADKDGIIFMNNRINQAIKDARDEG